MEVKNKSRIEITTESGIARGLHVLLNPKQINFKKDLTVTRNGKVVFEGEPEYSAWAILVSIGQNRDPEQYFMGKVKVSD